MAAKTFRTKPFLLATAGSTVDGRTIDEKMLKEMAKSYDPKTYGARVNIEHIRGISPDAPFNAYGDVVELSIGEVDVNFNGQTEKRVALYGVLELNEQAKALNDKGQKLYPSVEILDNFGGKGFAYLMGCALTDSPASIATERMQFNRTDPSRLNVAAEDAALLEFVEEVAPAGNAQDTFFNRLGKLLEPFTKPAEPKEPEGKNPAAPTFDAAAFAAAIQGFGKQVDAALAAQALEFTKQVELIGARVDKLVGDLEKTPLQQLSQRPPATGEKPAVHLTDC